MAVGFSTGALRISGEKKDILQVFVVSMNRGQELRPENSISRAWVYLVLNGLDTFILLCVVYDNSSISIASNV